MTVLYKPRKIVGQSFKSVGVKRVTVPKQSLSLAQIVRRFVRREALPVSVDGIYETRFGDLEKLKSADIYDRLERAEQLRTQISEFEARTKKENAEAAERAKQAEAAEVEKRIAAAVAAKEKAQTAP